MTTKIQKYELPETAGNHTIEMKADSNPLKYDIENGALVLYVTESDDAVAANYNFAILETGDEVSGGFYFGTVVLANVAKHLYRV